MLHNAFLQYNLFASPARRF